MKSPEHEDLRESYLKYLPVAFRRLGKVPVAIITGVFAISIMLFGIIFAGLVGLVIIGAVTFANIIDFADAALFLCIFINVIGLCILAPVVKKGSTSTVGYKA